jgi:hypothetical protein
MPRCLVEPKRLADVVGVMRNAPTTSNLYAVTEDTFGHEQPQPLFLRVLGFAALAPAKNDKQVSETVSADDEDWFSALPPAPKWRA